MQFFNDNRRFALNNERLFIFDSETHEMEFMIDDIVIDYDSHTEDFGYVLAERVSISKNDSLVAFTSNHNIYCLKMDTKVYDQVTCTGRDFFPTFNNANVIYFVRSDSLREQYTLMSIKPDGSELIEYCTFEEKVNRILPGNVDQNKIFIVERFYSFYEYDIETNELDLLCEIPNHYGKIINRSNDDRFFSFCETVYIPERHSTFLYDTSNEYLYEDLNIFGTETAKIQPDGELILIINSWPYLAFLDIQENDFVGDNLIIEFGASGYLTDQFDISKDSNNIILFQDFIVK
jgi:hypothetical protein